MKKFNFFIIVLLVLGFVNLVSANFSDISNYQYKISIENLKNLGVVEGYTDGTYKPNQQINRAEFLKIVIESLEEKIDFSGYSNCFPDVKDEWFAKYVCYAKEMGHVQGYPDGNFQPAQDVNYVEALKIVYEINGNQGREHPIPTRHLWYAKYLEDAQGKGIALQELEPAGLLTRGEMAELMVRFSERINTPPEDECSLSEDYEGVKIPIVEADFETCRVLPGGHFAVDKDHVYRRLSDPGSSTVYDYQIAEGVDPATFEDLGFYYFKDKDGVYNDTGWYITKIPSIDKETVQILSTHFIKDKSYVYRLKYDYGSDPYGSLPFEKSSTVELEIVEGVDVASFEAMVRPYSHEDYFKDKNHVYYKNHDIIKILNEADLETFEVLDNGYAKDKNHVYKNGYELKILDIADPETFEFLRIDLTKDKNHVYNFQNKIIEGIHAETFEIIEDSYYKDKNNVYYQFTVIEDADPDTFEILSSLHDYARDKNYVFKELDKLSGADPETFEVLAFGYTKDSNYVYHEGVKIEGADPETFQMVGHYAAKDISNVYYESRIIEGIDAATFKIITQGSFDYYIDKFHVYYGWIDEIIEEADPASFQPLGWSDGYAKDKNFVFYRTTVIEGADPETFEVLSYTMGKDKNNVYHYERVLEGVDPETY